MISTYRLPFAGIGHVVRTGTAFGFQAIGAGRA
jgi:hypothetical protein